MQPSHRLQPTRCNKTYTASRGQTRDIAQLFTLSTGLGSPRSISKAWCAAEESHFPCWNNYISRQWLVLLLHQPYLVAIKTKTCIAGPILRTRCARPHIAHCCMASSPRKDAERSAMLCTSSWTPICLSEHLTMPFTTVHSCAAVLTRKTHKWLGATQNVIGTPPDEGRCH